MQKETDMEDEDLGQNLPEISQEKLTYANWLDWGMKIGFVLLVATFALYVLGITKPHIPLDQLPQYWSMPVNEYLKANQLHTGWSWLHLVHKGDFMNFIGIAFLSAVTIVCYIRILPIYLSKKDMVYFSVSVIEVLILVLAASGVLVGGH
jgi:hypothetical protein